MKTRRIEFRVTPEQAEAYDEQAEAEGLSLSEWARQVLSSPQAADNARHQRAMEALQRMSERAKRFASELEEIRRRIQ